MGNGKVVPIGTITDGEAEKPYVFFGDRLPLFLADYPPKDGWAVVHQSQKAYPETDPTFWLFKAQLKNSDGVVVAEGGAMRRIVEYKDFEKGETAAYQRLLTFLGYPGDPELWDYEKQDVQQQQEPSSMVPEGKASSGESHHGDGIEPEPVSTAAEISPSSGCSQTLEFPDAEETPANTTTPTVASNIPKGIVRRIEVLAQKNGVEVPVYTTVQEARDVIALLQG